MKNIFYFIISLYRIQVLGLQLFRNNIGVGYLQLSIMSVLHSLLGFKYQISSLPEKSIGILMAASASKSLNLQ